VSGAGYLGPCGRRQGRAGRSGAQARGARLPLRRHLSLVLTRSIRFGGLTANGLPGSRRPSSVRHPGTYPGTAERTYPLVRPLVDIASAPRPPVHPWSSIRTRSTRSKSAGQRCFQTAGPVPSRSWEAFRFPARWRRRRAMAVVVLYYKYPSQRFPLGLTHDKWMDDIARHSQ